ncbi:YbaB/EbfC family nucleoid-associated protein [Actinocrispum wychmicini]|uniref:DNA-binding protein YbaB n=1 Tax=Actinocrispum wychmicini TaxID=1213861 RepID=A0A4V2S6T4_9PSEU|nr:YbaB/EbfC family nucleoid-associated protein [Actinocrispum wychmicini]TCO57280.1 DNA-binding protein YbaB [Actinocrispum wychmicini]
MSEPLFTTGAEAKERLDRLAAETRAKAERYQAMQAKAGQVSVTEKGKDDVVTVTIDSAGNVTDLRITDAVKDMTGEQVANAVLTTLRRAQSRLPERLSEVMAETIGDDQRTIDAVVANYRAKFPAPKDPDAEPTTPDTGDWDERPLLTEE